MQYTDPDPFTNKRYIKLLVGIFYTILSIALASFEWGLWSQGERLEMIAWGIAGFIILEQCIEYCETVIGYCEQWLADGYEATGSSESYDSPHPLDEHTPWPSEGYTGATERLEL